MNPHTLNKTLSKLPLSVIRYFDSVGSTNDEALAWAANDAKDLSLVVADEQTAGRGRHNRKWFTPKETALAFSLVLRPTADEKTHLARTVGWAGLSVADSLRTRGLDARIKWPNDILLNDRKVAGILVESVWQGTEVDCSVIGVGINVMKASVPPADRVQFPATSLEELLGFAIDREKLLRDILAGMIALRPHIGTDSFIASLEKNLAFRGEQVQIETGDGPPILGLISGLESDGSLRLMDEHGKFVTVQFGDVRLRPLA